MTLPNYIRMGFAEIIVSGGSEAAVTIAGIGGFNAMHALSTRNEDPKTASRPFDRDRDGFVLGEGAGALILEEYEHAKARGAKIYAELAGGGLSADAHHMTAPHPEGIGAKKVMINCLRDAGLNPEDVDTINMHGTSTPLGDVAETNAVKAVFGDHAYKININSTKSMTGTCLELLEQLRLLPVLWLLRTVLFHLLSTTKRLMNNLIPNYSAFGESQRRNVNVALSNTFGFGGHNACLIFKKIS